MLLELVDCHSFLKWKSDRKEQKSREHKSYKLIFFLIQWNKKKIERQGKNEKRKWMIVPLDKKEFDKDQERA